MEPLKLGILGVAHLHVDAYVAAIAARDDAAIVGVYDHDAARAQAYAEGKGLTAVGYARDLVAASDAVVICSENVHHAALVTLAAEGGKPALVEKPIGISEADFSGIEAAAARVTVMTAFPCRFSPAYEAAKRRVAAGEIGTLRAISATNRGQCPFGWFVQPELSGGGAMIDHVVHVADLLNDLLGVPPETVTAETGHRMYGEAWEDCAMVSLGYADGLFATLDASWSRPKGHRIWGDVMLTLTGDAGVIELDLFGAGILSGGSLVGYGSDLDSLMVAEFVRAVREGDPKVTAAHGIAAARVALRAYASLGGPALADGVKSPV